ncbi:MAG: methionine adenosyltransferase [Myxococcota bacterium]
MSRSLFTSESVTEGHPDKICDKISDAVLDAIIAEDPTCRVACETLVKTGYVNLAGEVTTSTYVNLPEIVRKTIREIGYTSSEMGFDADSCGVLVALEAQSPDIALGVDGKGVYTDEQGAGDQGMMFGYACTETDELMPMPISLAHKLTRRLTYVRKREKESFLRPDGKSQVTVEYGDDGMPQRVDAVVVSTQHSEDVSYDTLKEFIMEEVIKPTIPTNLLDANTNYFVNPTGRFVIGGPMGDSGLTGRKIIVDTYGGMGRHGGGAFSGKDPSKVDRSAAYYSRYIAKNLVAAGLCTRCEVQLAYAIGVAKPVSIRVESFGTGKVPDARLSEIVDKHFDARPGRLIAELDLLKPIFCNTAAYGHFGREDEAGFNWERRDRVDALKAEL